MCQMFGVFLREFSQKFEENSLACIDSRTNAVPKIYDVTVKVRTTMLTSISNVHISRRRRKTRVRCSFKTGAPVLNTHTHTHTHTHKHRTGATVQYRLERANRLMRFLFVADSLTLLAIPPNAL